MKSLNFNFANNMKIIFTCHNKIFITLISSQRRKERELWKDDIAPQVKHNGRDLHKSPLYNERMYGNNQSMSGPQGRTLSTIAGRYPVNIGEMQYLSLNIVYVSVYCVRLY